MFGQPRAADWDAKPASRDGWAHNPDIALFVEHHFQRLEGL
jgi:hypothetical protein